MTTQHGKRSTYSKGCRCDDCKGAEYSYQEKRRQTKLMADSPGDVVSLRVASEAQTPELGPVEAGVRAELEGLAQAQLRPGVAETAFALARILDSPRAVNQQPAASKALVDILDRLRKGADVRKSRLAGVRDMTSAKTGTR